MGEPITVADADRALNAALAHAQGEFPPIPRDQTANAGSYSYKYASLGAILAAVRPVLVKHGLSIVQRLEAPGGTPSLRTELRHASGGTVAGSFPLPFVPEDEKQLGTLVTYLRRYTLSAMLGIAPDEDTDGTPVRVAEKPSGVSEPPRPKPITGLQIPLMMQAFAAKGMADREMRLAYTVAVIGRTVESAKELTSAEASRVIDSLERFDRDNPDTWPQPAQTAP